MMRHALALAQRGALTTYPNPNVGCVITQDDVIVGEGFHYRAGEPHAEVHALQMAGELAKGSTVYVTLEPCSHFGRTPPCADALIQAQVKHVICAMVDPNPDVAGRGIERLKAAGIQVSVGLLQDEAIKLNVAFIKKMMVQQPYVQLKMAMSADGRTALSNGQSQWITSTEARQDVQVFRAQAGAILSTAKTVNDDNASLNVRWSDLPANMQKEQTKTQLRQPIRVILDRQGLLDRHGKLFSTLGEIWIITARQDVHYAQSNVRVFHVPCPSAQFELSEILMFLFHQGIHHIWVEAGATLAGRLIEEDLVDEFILYQAPKLMGSDSRELISMTGFTHMEQLPQFQFTDVKMIGPDVRLRMQKKDRIS